MAQKDRSLERDMSLDRLYFVERLASHVEMTSIILILTALLFSLHSLQFGHNIIDSGGLAPNQCCCFCVFHFSRMILYSAHKTQICRPIIYHFIQCVLFANNMAHPNQLHSKAHHSCFDFFFGFSVSILHLFAVNVLCVFFRDDAFHANLNSTIHAMTK